MLNHGLSAVIHVMKWLIVVLEESIEVANVKAKLEASESVISELRSRQRPRGKGDDDTEPEIKQVQTEVSEENKDESTIEEKDTNSVDRGIPTEKGQEVLEDNAREKQDFDIQA